MALKELQGKDQGDDGITTKLLKALERPVLVAFGNIFNSVILEGKSPRAWQQRQ